MSTTTSEFETNLAALSKQTSCLKGIQRGLEKESLRITPDGKLSQTAHPKALGSTLTHPNITTDYSEALLELITEPHQNIDSLLKQLQDTHTFIYQNIDDELLWVNSMPCILGGDLSIPIAQYGSSNIGKMKTVYRHGLWHRYGRHMQAIAGIHFNFSLPESFWQFYQQEQGNKDNLQDFISAQYFKLIRNFQRHSWLIIYLFGASPAVCASFVKDKQHKLLPMNEQSKTFHLKHATSLRMSDLGYQNDAQSDLMICYNSVESYTNSLEQAIRTPYTPYEEIGIKDGNSYKQLNANILQIENEYYSSIRPKRTGLSGERPTQALKNRGVEYIEVRSLDLNPFDHAGLHKNQIQFLDAFLLFCLLENDIQTSSEMLKASQKNLETVVYEGRNKNAKIIDCESEQSQQLGQAANKVLDGINKAAQLLDQAYETNEYSQSVDSEAKKIEDPCLTPSGKIIDTLEKEKISFFAFAMNQAKETKDFFNSQRLEENQLGIMQKLAAQSIEEQAKIEQSDTLDFDTFVANYFK
jgi:glutamate--cysteine ligase